MSDLRTDPPRKHPLTPSASLTGTVSSSNGSALLLDRSTQRAAT